MAEIKVLQNVHCEDLGIIYQVLKNYGFEPRYVQSYAGEAVPKALDDAVALIVMGGLMGVYEHARYPFLLEEMRLIEVALKAQKPVLGICLGSQLMAATLGAEVTQGVVKEIGWHKVELSDVGRGDSMWREVESSFVGYHWHGDVFELPTGAASLASSQHIACQAFSYGSNAYGLLFHMEITGKIIGDMVATFADELRQENLDGQEILARADENLPALQHRGRTFFQAWADQIVQAMS